MCPVCLLTIGAYVAATTGPVAATALVVKKIRGAKRPPEPQRPTLGDPHGNPENRVEG